MQLVTTTDKFQLVTSAAINVDVTVDAVDYVSSTVTPVLQPSAISTATTTDILAAPASSTYRKVRFMTVRNRDAATSVDVTVVLNRNGTSYELYKCTLAAGETLEFLEGNGFFLLSARSLYLDPTSVEVSQSQRVLRSSLPPHPVQAVGGFLLISATAYAVYVGRMVRAVSVAFVESHVTTIGAGAQTAEIGLFSSPSAPNKSAQTLTKLVATGTVDALTGTGMKRNTTTFAQSVPANTHLWAVIRTAMATTQPTCIGMVGDMSEGQILALASASALTGVSSIAGAIPAIGTGLLAPDLRVTLD